MKQRDGVINETFRKPSDITYLYCLLFIISYIRINMNILHEPTAMLVRHKGVTIRCNLELSPNGQLTYTMNWSDCPNMFEFSSDDDNKVLEIKNKLENRLDNFIEGKVNSFTTSDLNINYIKKR